MEGAFDLAKAAGGAQEAALELRDLARFYAGIPAVDGVSLLIRKGEFVTLLGPSGSGKTTTLKMVAGFDLPDSGSIHLAGRDITRAQPNERNIGMVFQNYALFPHMTIFDNVAFPLRMRRQTRKEIAASVERMLALVQLSGMARRYPRQLSGGQQQRVALARALVFEPPLLLMDEPLGALDRQLRRQVQTEIKRIHQSLGVTIVFVTHDQEEAMFLSDRIAVMRHGRIVQEGAPPELYLAPNSRFVAGFVGESNFLAGTVTATGKAVTVRLADGTVAEGRAAVPLVPGQAVDCMLRPENIELAAAGEAGAINTIMAMVELASFLGEAMALELATPVGRVTVRTAIRSGAPLFAPGQAVGLRWAATDLRIFPAEATS